MKFKVNATGEYKRIDGRKHTVHNLDLWSAERDHEMSTLDRIGSRNQGSGIKAVESRQWNQGSGIKAVESRQWNHGSGIKAVESRQWNHGSGITAVESRQWNQGSGIKAVESRQWNQGSGIKAVESRQWNHGSGIKAVESRQWNQGSGSISYTVLCISKSRIRSFVPDYIMKNYDKQPTIQIYKEH